MAQATDNATATTAATASAIASCVDLSIGVPSFRWYGRAERQQMAATEALVSRSAASHCEDPARPLTELPRMAARLAPNQSQIAVGLSSST